MDEKKPAVKIAAALRYDPGTDGAPRVTAKGRGFLAEKILEIAANHDIPVKREPDLAKMSGISSISTKRFPSSSTAPLRRSWHSSTP
jgi:type III secretion system FlhB-like substrate exporter